MRCTCRGLGEILVLQHPSPSSWYGGTRWVIEKIPGKKGDRYRAWDAYGKWQVDTDSFAAAVAALEKRARSTVKFG